MSADECHDRAAACAANAALTPDETVRLAFLRLAAQWRAMATREIFLGAVEALVDAPVAAGGPTRLPG